MSTPTSGNYALLPKNTDDNEIDDDDDSISKLSHSSMGDPDRYIGAEDADIESEGVTDDDEPPTPPGKNTKHDEKKPMSTTRRICFLGSLIICIVFIFVFAFFFPCNKPSCFATTKECDKDAANVKKLEYHSLKFPHVLSFSPVRLWDVNHDGNSDIMIGTKSGITLGISTKKCNGTFLDQECPGSVFAVSGKDGDNLWQFNTLEKISFIACARRNDQPQPECALRGSTTLYYIDTWKRELIWSNKITGSMQAMFIIQDINSDMSNDVIFAYNKINGHGWLELSSGKTGAPIGSSVPLPQHHTVSDIILLHEVKEESHILVSSHHENKHFLWAISLQDLFLDATQPGQHTEKAHWGSRQPSTSSRFYELLHSEIPISVIQSDLNLDGVADFVFCTDNALLAWNGRDFAQLWSQPLDFDHKSSSLTVGRFTPDDIPDILTSLKLQNGSALFIITDGSNGSQHWMWIGEKATTADPVTIATTEHWNDGFVFWIETTQEITGSNYSKRDTLTIEKSEQTTRESSLKPEVYERRQRRYPDKSVENHPKLSPENTMSQRNTGKESHALENQDFEMLLDSLPETTSEVKTQEHEKRMLDSSDDLYDYPALNVLPSDYSFDKNTNRDYVQKFLHSLQNQDVRRSNTHHSGNFVHIRRRRDVGFKGYRPLIDKDYIFENRLGYKENNVRESRRTNSQHWPPSLGKQDLNLLFDDRTETRDNIFKTNTNRGTTREGDWYRDFKQKQKSGWVIDGVVKDFQKKKRTAGRPAAQKNVDGGDPKDWQSYFDLSRFSSHGYPKRNTKMNKDVEKVKKQSKVDTREARDAETSDATEKSTLQTDVPTTNPNAQLCPHSSTRLQGFMLHYQEDSEPAMNLIAQELVTTSDSHSPCSLLTPKIQSTPGVGNVDDNGKIQLVYAINYYMESDLEKSKGSYMMVKKLSLPFKPRITHSIKRRNIAGKRPVITISTDQDDFALPIEM